MPRLRRLAAACGAIGTTQTIPAHAPSASAESPQPRSGRATRRVLRLRIRERTTPCRLASRCAGCDPPGRAVRPRALPLRPIQTARKRARATRDRPSSRAGLFTLEPGRRIMIPGFRNARVIGPRAGHPAPVACSGCDREDECALGEPDEADERRDVRPPKGADAFVVDRDHGAHPRDARERPHVNRKPAPAHAPRHGWQAERRRRGDRPARAGAVGG